jgi:hypothetical protein
MSKRFASVRSLFAGTALAAPAEDDEAPAPVIAPGNAAATAGPTQAAVEAAVAAEVDAATNAATAAANTRWNTVMTADAGIANPKAAARLLSSTPMSADDIVATLGDLGQPAAAAPRGNREATTENRERLATEPATNPRTGGNGGDPATARGEGGSASATNLAEHREKRSKERNAAALTKGGKQVNSITG